MKINRKGQVGLVAAFIGIMIAVIVGVGVVIPVIKDTITNSSITGTTATILEYLPLMLAVVLFVGVAGLIYMRQ
jgi:hypothetical protein